MHKPGSVARFFRRLTQGNAADAANVRSVAQRERAIAKAMRDLDEEGV